MIREEDRLLIIKKDMASGIDLYKNYCSRCGKERVVWKIWKEKVGNSVVETRENICPDKSCQSLVNKELKDKVNKRIKAEESRRERMRVRVSSRVSAKA